MPLCRCVGVAVVMRWAWQHLMIDGCDVVMICGRGCVVMIGGCGTGMIVWCDVVIGGCG